jgi:hypothetical protein
VIVLASDSGKLKISGGAGMLLRVGENIQAYNASCEAVAAAVATAVEATVQLTSVPSNYRPK